MSPARATEYLEIRLFVKGFCQSHDGYDYYDLREHTGFIRTLMIETSSHGQG